MTSPVSRGLFASLLVVSALGCGDPFFGLAGGRLAGDVVEVPPSWVLYNDTDTVQLETRPADPYSVNVWGVGTSAGYFVAAGAGLEAVWAQQVTADPRVRLRVADSVYELRAVRVDSWIDRRRYKAMATQKYDDFNSAFEDFDAAVLFRLEPR